MTFNGSYASRAATLLRLALFLALFLRLANELRLGGCFRGLANSRRLGLDLRRGDDRDRGVRVIDDLDAIRHLEIADVERVPDRDVRDIGFDAPRDVDRVDANRELRHHLAQNAAGHPDTLGRAREHDGHVHRHLLAGDELLEVDVQNLLLERVALDLADERA